MSQSAGLAALNFFTADVHGGLGPFLATWLAAGAHWSPEWIGIVMTVSGIAGLIFNAPAGALVDRIGQPRLILAIAAAAVVAGTLALLPAQGFAEVLSAQVLAAAGGALMGPALTALTLTLVGKERFAHQQGRNEAWNHAGNVAAALLVAAATLWVGATSAFWVLAGMAAGCLASITQLPSGDGEIVRDREPAGRTPNTRLTELLADRRVLALGVALLLFHLGNAAMLPLLGQRMAAIGHGDPTRWLAACVIVAQLTMIPVAVIASWLADRVNRAWLLVAACAVLVVRGLLVAVAVDPIWLIPIQMLDAGGAGTLGVAVPVLVADYTWGSGKTQTALGVVTTFQGIGAALSASLGGVVATWFGWTRPSLPWHCRRSRHSFWPCI